LPVQAGHSSMIAWASSMMLSSGERSDFSCIADLPEVYFGSMV
jgi:hypothetical protein